MTDPKLIFTRAPKNPDGIALVLHGGREVGQAPVRGNQLAVVRMIPIAHRIAAAARGRLAIVRVLDVVRGWNGSAASPVADAEWAVSRTLERFGDLPVSLVGHSMGGRAAMRAAGAPNVRSVVGLAPWLPPGEPTTQLRDKQVLIVHGSADRMTSPARSAAFARALVGVAAQVSYVERPRRAARHAAPPRRLRRVGRGVRHRHPARPGRGPHRPANRNRPACEHSSTGAGRPSMAGGLKQLGTDRRPR